MTFPIRRARLMALAGLLALGSASAVGPAAGTVIQNTATLTGVDAENNSYTETSNVVSATVIHVPSVSVTGGGPVVSFPGDVAISAFTVTNTSNDTDDFELWNSPSDDSDEVVVDTDASGSITPGDLVMRVDAGAPVVTLAADASVMVWVRSAVPAGAQAGEVSVYELFATSQADVTIQDAAETQVTTGSVYDVNIAVPAVVTTPAPGKVVQSFLVTNASNRDMNTDLVFLPEPTPSFATLRWQAGTDVAWHGTAQDAWDAYLDSRSPLAVGETVPLRVETTLDNTVTDGSFLTFGMRYRLDASNSLTVRNDAATPEDIGWALDVSVPVLTVQKDQYPCLPGGGNKVVCATPVNTGAEVGPCELIRYQVWARNRGSAMLQQAMLADQIMAGLWIKSVTATATPGGHDALVRLNGGAWSASLGPSLAGRVEAVVDSDDDGFITAADGLPANTDLFLEVVVQVPGAGCSVGDTYEIERGGGGDNI